MALLPATPGVVLPPPNYQNDFCNMPSVFRTEGKLPGEKSMPCARSCSTMLRNPQSRGRPNGAHPDRPNAKLPPSLVRAHGCSRRCVCSTPHKPLCSLSAVLGHWIDFWKPSQNVSLWNIYGLTPFSFFFANPGDCDSE